MLASLDMLAHRGRVACSVVGLDDFDGAAWAGGSGEAPVAGEQGGLEGLGEGDVGGVVDREVVSQLPAAGEERSVLDALHRHIAEIIESQPDPPGIQEAAASESAPHRRHFEVDQRRRGELLAAEPVPDGVAVRAIIEEGYG